MHELLKLLNNKMISEYLLKELSYYNYQSEISFTHYDDHHNIITEVTLRYKFVYQMPPINFTWLAQINV